MISIVLPVYNGERYIEESIQSVMEQSYKDWELIIVNDCSTDNTKNIIEKYVKIDSRIRVINNAINKKLPNSLNVGFANAKGKYLTWTSDDNRYEKDALEKMYQQLESHPEYGMVYCDMYYIDEDGLVTGKVSKKEEELFLNNCIGACFLYRHDLANEIGDYDPTMFLVEDYDYWLRLRKKKKIYHLEEYLYYYRNHGESLTATKQLQIQCKLNELRMRELDFLLKNLDQKKKVTLFYEMCMQNLEEKEKLVQMFWGEENLPKELHWLVKERKMKEDKQIILFGAGDFGRKALEYFGNEKVECFVDNNEAIVGTNVNGKEIISFSKLKEISKDYQVVISVDTRKAVVLAEQLEENNITDYITYVELVNSLGKHKGERMDFLPICQKACQWIMANSIKKEGIINNTSLRKSYPEVTGYYIPTLLKWGFRDLAFSYARWLCSIQHENGAWYDTEDKDPYVFDSAQILKGLLAIREAGLDVDKQIIKGCDWIVSNMNDEGRLITPSKKEWGEDGVCSELIHLYCITPLIEAAEIYGKQEYKKAAEKIKNFYLENYKQDILNFNFLSHFYAYVMEALCDLGEIDLAKEAMEGIARSQRDNGMVPAYKNVEWVCSTGLFQLAIVWYKLGELERGNRTFEYAVQLQNESGGWYGSYPTHDNPKVSDFTQYPNYFETSEISWAVKYFLDAVYYKCKLEFEIQAPIFNEHISKDDGRYRVVLDQIQRTNAKKICDVGCGKGRYIHNLLQDIEDISCYAVDMSEKVMSLLNPIVEKNQGALTNIPYSDESFDLVYAVESLEHSIFPENAVKELLRVTKLGGKVVIIDKNKSKLGKLEIDEWEQWFDNEFFEKLAEQMKCALEVDENIPYDDSEADGLFTAWILRK